MSDWRFIRIQLAAPARLSTITSALTPGMAALLRRRQFPCGPGCHAPRRARQSDIQPLVSDDERARRIEVQLANRPVHQSARRLAAIAWATVGRDGAVRMVRTIVIRVDARPAGGETRAEVAVRLLDERFREEPPRHPRLIGDDDDDEAGAIEGADGVDGPWKQRDPIQAIEIADVFDQRAVAIQKDCGFHKLLRAAARTVATSMPRMHR